MKLHQFQKQLQKQKIDVALFFDFQEKITPNAFYFVQKEFSGCLVIPKNKKSFIVTSKMEAEKAKKTKLPVLSFEHSLFEKVLKRISHAKTIGLDHGGMTVSFLDYLKKRIKKLTKKKYQYKNIAPICQKLRLTKTKKELSYLKKACRTSDAILKKCFQQWKRFKTEKDVEDFLIQETRRYGCGLSFRPVIASGKGASQPHYTPQNKKLQKGFCVIDFGVKYYGYCSDTTRTIYLGTPSLKEKAIYQVLLKAQQQAIKNASIGKTKTFSELHVSCMKDLGAYSRYCIHSLGHGVGIEIHEAPSVSEKSKSKLQNGMVFTIEPGIYVENKFGMRIEDTCVMQHNKTVPLTRISKKLIIKK